MRSARELQSQLPLETPGMDHGFRFTWWNTREGAPVWAAHRGSWLPGTVVRRARKYVTVVLTGRKNRTYRVRRAYGELRRRAESPRLTVAIGRKR